jgi:hypothetical protein
MNASYEEILSIFPKRYAISECLSDIFIRSLKDFYSSDYSMLPRNHTVMTRLADKAPNIMMDVADDLPF